jgi:hypothetical protein
VKAEFWQAWWNSPTMAGSADDTKHRNGSEQQQRYRTERLGDLPGAAALDGEEDEQDRDHRNRANPSRCPSASGYPASLCVKNKRAEQYIHYRLERAVLTSIRLGMSVH